MKKMWWTLVCCGCLLCLAACGRRVATEEQTEQEPGEQAITFTDDLDREVTVAEPQRVATLIGSFTDVWCLAGGEDTLAASAGDAWTQFGL